MTEEEAQEVKNWLENLGCSKYSGNFIENQINLDFLPCLTAKDLVEMGINDSKIQHKILSSIKQIESDSNFNDHDKTDEYFEPSRSKVHYREISYKEIQLNPTPISRGAFGVIYKGMWRGQEIALKKLQFYLESNLLEDFRREAALMERVCFLYFSFPWSFLPFSLFPPVSPFSLFLLSFPSPSSLPFPFSFAFALLLPSLLPLPFPSLLYSFSYPFPLYISLLLLLGFITFQSLSSPFKTITLRPFTSFLTYFPPSFLPFPSRSLFSPIPFLYNSCIGLR